MHVFGENRIISESAVCMELLFYHILQLCLSHSSRDMDTLHPQITQLQIQAQTTRSNIWGRRSDIVRRRILEAEKVRSVIVHINKRMIKCS